MSDFEFLIVTKNDKVIRLVIAKRRQDLEAILAREFAQHQFINGQDDGVISQYRDEVISYLGGNGRSLDLPYDIGSYPQYSQKILNYLYQIPFGQKVHYSDIASNVGSNAVRAIGSICANNPMALLLPCHRVVPKSGGIGNYRWGVDIKQYLLNMEAESDNAGA